MAHFHARRIRAAPLRFNKLELVGLILFFFARRIFANFATYEALVFLDDALHALFEVFQELRGDGVNVSKVVVETIFNKRPDAEVRLREDLLYRLGKHVSGRMPQNIEAVRRIDSYRFHGGSIEGSQVSCEIPQFAVNFKGDDAAIGLIKIRPKRLLFE